MVNPVNFQNTAKNSARRLYQTQIVVSRKTSESNSPVLPCNGNSNSNAIGTLSLSEKVEAIFSRWHVHHKRLAPAAEKLFYSLQNLCGSSFPLYLLAILLALYLFNSFVFLLFYLYKSYPSWVQERERRLEETGRGRLVMVWAMSRSRVKTFTGTLYR